MSAAEENDQHWQVLLNASVDAIVVIDQSGVIQRYNKATETMFGYAKRNLVGENVSVLMPLKYGDKHNSFIESYIQTKQAKIIGKGRITQGLKANGKIFPIHLSVGQFSNDKGYQFIGIIRDLTELERYRLDAQKLRERLAHVTRLNAVGELVAGVVHEMNQPLAAISNYTNANKNIVLKHIGELTRHWPTQETRCFSDQIHEIQVKIEAQISRAVDLNNKLKNFVKARGGKRDKTDLNQLIIDTVCLAKIDTRLRKHHIVVSLNDHPPPVVYTDPVQLQQVLLNLIRNGLDAMESTGDDLLISTEWLSTAEIRVNIVDRGEGIDEEIKHALFEPFVTSKEDGMGMGLAVSQSIVHAYGQKIKKMAFI